MQISVRAFILAKRVTDRVGGAQRRVSHRCRTERAERAQPADANLGEGIFILFFYFFIFLFFYFFIFLFILMCARTITMAPT